MSTEREKHPSDTALMHLEPWELARLYTEVNGDGNMRTGNNGFNELYAAEAPELNIPYTPELVLEKFGPLIEILKRETGNLNGRKILELGGGSGLLAFFLQQQGALITLVETQEVFVQKARTRGVEDARLYDGVNLFTSVEGKFRVLLAHRVFEEIVMEEYRARVLATQTRSILEPDGIIITGTQNGSTWNDAIRLGSKLPLFKTYTFPEHDYVREVNILKNELKTVVLFAFNYYPS